MRLFLTLFLRRQSFCCASSNFTRMKESRAEKPELVGFIELPAGGWRGAELKAWSMVHSIPTNEGSAWATVTWFKFYFFSCWGACPMSQCSKSFLDLPAVGFNFEKIKNKLLSRFKSLRSSVSSYVPLCPRRTSCQECSRWRLWEHTSTFQEQMAVSFLSKLLKDDWLNLEDAFNFSASFEA